VRIPAVSPSPRRRLRTVALALTLASGLACALPLCARPQSPRPAQSGATLATLVTIYRDDWGTPHVFGRTDASTVFGFAYAQAEDNFPQLEENFVLAIGRGAELYGPDLLAQDRLNRTLRVEQLARADYDALDLHLRALCDAFAAGVRYYLERHPSIHSRLLTRIEPWYPLAFIRYSYYQNGFVHDPKLGALTLQTADGGRLEPTHNGSNGWVIAPSRSATGHAMLFIDPHLGYFGPGQVYEGHIHSDEGSGWEFSGYARFGFPFPYIGHNAGVGWMSTDNVADEVDGYIEHFDDPVHPLSYRYGGDHRLATEYHDTIRVKTPTGIEERVYTSTWTHHGPIVSTAGGLPVAARMAKSDSHGWLAEWYHMTKAASVAELREALAPLDMLFGNIMAADRHGTIYYVYNAAVPRRDSAFNWSAPVDGSDPRTEWQRYYGLDELPHLTNPATGWMENCNTSPFLLTGAGNPDPAQYPRYMVREGTFPGWDAQNPRAMASWRILSTTPRFTFDEWARAALDTHVITADSLLPHWLDRLRSTVAPGTRLDTALSLLAAWDHRSTVVSVPTTLYTTWLLTIGARVGTFDVDRLREAPGLADALTTSLDTLERAFGSWRVPYGDLVRLQRPIGYAHPPFGAPAFSDDDPGLAIPAVPGDVGAVFTVRPVPGIQGKRRYGVHGDTYVSVVEFGPETHARSVMIFGESANPRSPHFMDQARLIAAGRMKPSWFTLAEVRAHAIASYHPGTE
jgi:acyl-homoserine-lactone acylase